MSKQTIIVKAVYTYIGTELTELAITYKSGIVRRFRTYSLAGQQKAREITKTLFNDRINYNMKFIEYVNDVTEVIYERSAIK